MKTLGKITSTVEYCTRHSTDTADCAAHTWDGWTVLDTEVLVPKVSFEVDTCRTGSCARDSLALELGGAKKTVVDGLSLV